MHCKKYIPSVLLLSLIIAGQAFAFPFNDDMVDVSIRTGSFARQRVEGTVPNGSAKLQQYEKKENVPADLKNPVEADSKSLIRGERLFSANCSPCHGNIDQKPYTPGVAGVAMGAPNVSDPFYHDRTDASLYSTIRFGNVIMPALGWKLSDQEIWDTINWLHKVQQENKAPAAATAASEK